MCCFLARPEDYDLVTGKVEKVIFIIFTGDEIKDYNRLVSLAGEETAQATIKNNFRKREVKQYAKSPMCRDR